MKSAPGYIVLVLVTYIAIVSCSSRQKRAAFEKTVMLTDLNRMEILNIHNKLRLNGGPSNMRYMTWDSQLEWIAEEYGKKCVWEHNRDRRKLYGRSSVGENMWKSSGKVNASKAVGAVQAWYNEISNFDYDTHTCQAGKVCGHYTQVVWATTYKVGCAMTVCNDGTTFTCDYAPAGNVVSNGKYGTIFKKGRSCSACDEGDFCRGGLCANSSRDFIEEPEKPSMERTTGLAVTVALMTLIIVAFIAFTVYRERENIPPKYRLWEKWTNRNSNQNISTGPTGQTTRPSTNSAYENIHAEGKVDGAKPYRVPPSVPPPPKNYKV